MKCDIQSIYDISSRKNVHWILHDKIALLSIGPHLAMICNCKICEFDFLTLAVVDLHISGEQGACAMPLVDEQDKHGKSVLYLQWYIS